MRKFTEEFIEKMRKALPQVEGFEVETIQPEKYSAII